MYGFGKNTISVKNASFTTFLLLTVVALTGFSLLYKLFNVRERLKLENYFRNLPIVSKNATPDSPPEISGWVAWWMEDEAYTLIQHSPGKLTAVSPVWFMVNDNYQLTEVGKFDKTEALTIMKNANVAIYPSLGSELSGTKLSPLFTSDTLTDGLIASLLSRISQMNVDGIDVDLEAIDKADKANFLTFIEKLSDALHDRNLKMTVAVHAQTEEVEWEGVLGQDIAEIAKFADEVRIMTYDKHSAGSTPGAISPISWMKEVANYNSKLIAKEKIVFGIPSYGYIWTGEDAKGLQFDEFTNFLAGNDYEVARDKESFEQVFQSQNFIGWLSDSEAMIAKVSKLRSQGFNKFIIWHLGGMDEKFFAQTWQ